MDKAMYKRLEQSLPAEDVLHAESKLVEFLANVLLVLRGGRHAYLVNLTIEIEVTLLETVLRAEQSLTTIAVNKWSSLLVCRDKEREVRELFLIRQSSSDTHLALAHILDYAYQGRDWASGDRYAVTYHMGYRGIKSRLYTFTVPVSHYDDVCRAKVEATVALYSSFLTGLDFEFWSVSERI